MLLLNRSGVSKHRTVSQHQPSCLRRAETCPDGQSMHKLKMHKAHKRVCMKWRLRVCVLLQLSHPDLCLEGSDTKQRRTQRQYVPFQLTERTALEIQLSRPEQYGCPSRATSQLLTQTGPQLQRLGEVIVPGMLALLPYRVGISIRLLPLS